MKDWNWKWILNGVAAGAGAVSLAFPPLSAISVVLKCIATGIGTAVNVPRPEELKVRRTLSRAAAVDPQVRRTLSQLGVVDGRPSKTTEEGTV